MSFPAENLSWPLQRVAAPEISVVIPTLNEQRNIGPLVNQIREVLGSITTNAEIIVVDGGSTDRTWEEAESAGARCILQRRVGYGGALRESFLAARGEYVVTLDSDLSHPPRLIQDLWRQRTQADVVIGSRFTKGGDSQAPIFRKILSIILNFVFTKVLAIPITDSSSGYRLYRRSVLKPMKYRPENFNILQEIIVQAYADGYLIKEVPLKYEPRASGESHVSFFKFAASYLPTLYRLWLLRNSVASADYEARAFHSRHLLQRFWQRRRYKLLSEFTEEGARICDIGCGSSRFTQDHPNVTALDIAAHKLRYLRNTNPLRALGSAGGVPFANESFDTVVLSQVLSYVPDYLGALKEANRILKMGGTLVIAVPDSRRLNWKLIGFLYRLLPNTKVMKVAHTFRRSQLIDICAESGFRTLRYRYIYSAELVLKLKKVEQAAVFLR